MAAAADAKSSPKSEMEWNKEKTLLLIKEFHSRPGLWNMTHEDYRKREVKKILLEEISTKFDNAVTAAGIEKKFHTLRTQYHREISRMNTNRGSEPYKSKWFAFPHLEFLNDPSACRNAKDPRRRCVNTSIIATTAPAGLHVTVTAADKDSSSKNLQVLFDNNVDQDEAKGEEQNTTVGITYLQEESRLHDSINATTYEEEHLADENQEDIEEEQYTIESVPTTLKIIKPEHATVRRQNHEIYQDIVYEATGTHPMPPPPKRTCKDAETVVTPSVFMRDEYMTYGEFIANELRYITDRQILINVKHKINTALFEASVAQLEKSG